MCLGEKDQIVQGERDGEWGENAVTVNTMLGAGDV